MTGEPGAQVGGEVQRRDRGPLFGVRVLVTRAEAQADELASALRDHGAVPVVVPLISLVPPREPEALAELDGALARLAEYDGIVFSSANAVRYLAKRAREIGAELSAVRGRVFCVGRKTADVAAEAGLAVHRVASGRGDAEALLAELLEDAAPAGLRFLVPKSDLGRTVIPDGLSAAGAEVDVVQTYCNVRPEVDADLLCRELVEGSLPVLTFMSPSVVHHFASLLTAPARQAVVGTIVVAVGSTTAAALREAGIEPDVIPARPEVGELVAALAGFVEACGDAGKGGAKGGAARETQGQGDEA